MLETTAGQLLVSLGLSLAGAHGDALYLNVLQCLEC